MAGLDPAIHPRARIDVALRDRMDARIKSGHDEFSPPAQKYWLTALAVLTGLRLLVAATTPLSPDEAYYWVWSRTLAAGYLDHPPMVALFIRAGTILAGQGTLGVRLFSPLAAAAGSWLLARAGRDLFGAWRPGVVAAALLNATLLFGVGSVTVTPDTPLLLFWTGTLAAIARVIATGDGRWWLAAGLSAGLALDSKYTAILLAPCILVWLLWTARRWLVTLWPWLSALVVAAMFAPVVAWNAAHHWVSFAKQGSRAGDWQPAMALTHLTELIGGQAGLVTPLLFILFVAGVVWAVRARSPVTALLAAFTIVPTLVFLEHALGDRVQANWPAVLMPAAALAAAAMPGFRRWLRPAIGLGFSMTALVCIQGAAAPFALFRALDPTLIRTGGWDPLATEIAGIAHAEHAAFVAADNYGQAALLARLLPRDIPVVGVDARWSLFDLPAATIAGRTGLLLHSDRRPGAPDPGGWTALDRVASPVRARGGVVAETFGLYRATAAVDRPALPRRPD